MLDADGTFQYSRIVALTGQEQDGAERLVVYPDEGAGRLFIRGADAPALAGLYIYGASGQLLKQDPQAGDAVSIRDLDTGVYLVRLVLHDGRVYHRRFVIAR